MDASGGWKLDAACKDVDWKIFFANADAQNPDPAVQAVCDACPVRVECLAEALREDWWGTWGGTSYWQRRQLRRRYRRAICPQCRDEGGILIEMGDAQACLTCAVSWRATPARPVAR